MAKSTKRNWDVSVYQYDSVNRSGNGTDIFFELNIRANNRLKSRKSIEQYVAEQVREYLYELQRDKITIDKECTGIISDLKNGGFLTLHVRNWEYLLAIDLYKERVDKNDVVLDLFDHDITVQLGDDLNWRIKGAA